MERLIKYAKTIRTHWKKSTVAAYALYYGAATAKEKYDINIVMRAACKEAARYGDALIPMERNPTLVTVILNPVANKRKAKTDFEKYCAPLLYLAGLQVDVIQTTSEGHAKELVESLKGTEAIIVAGGDGTLSESVTGLLRRTDGANQFPLGILPLGHSNTLGNTMFPNGKGVEKVKQLIEASMAIIKGNTEWKDAMKIEPLVQEGEEPRRPIFALASIEWGAFRDTMAKRDNYWFVGPLRDYLAFIINGFRSSLTWDCSGTIKYTPPCAGCSNCVARRAEVKRKWAIFMPTSQAASQDTKNENPECETVNELCFKTCDFKIVSSNVESNGNVPALNIVLGKNKFSYTEFVSEGWSRLKNVESRSETIPVRTVEVYPLKDKDDVVIEIDKEDFDLKPLKITLLPKVVRLFCNPQINGI